MYLIALDTENQVVCDEVANAFGFAFGFNEWLGDASEADTGLSFPEFLSDNALYQLVTDLDLEFSINVFDSIQAWKDAGEPLFGSASLVVAKNKR